MLRVLIIAVLTAFVVSENYDYDVIVYTGNGAGCQAAVNAAAKGAKVLLIEPSRLLGGMTGGGGMPGGGGMAGGANFCANCGNRRAGGNFCSNCGARFA